MSATLRNSESFYSDLLLVERLSSAEALLIHGCTHALVQATSQRQAYVGLEQSIPDSKHWPVQHRTRSAEGGQ